jgi:hypothetical protein
MAAAAKAISSLSLKIISVARSEKNTMWLSSCHGCPAKTAVRAIPCPIRPIEAKARVVKPLTSRLQLPRRAKPTATPPPVSIEFPVSHATRTTIGTVTHAAMMK